MVLNDNMLNTLKIRIFFSGALHTQLNPQMFV